VSACAAVAQELSNNTPNYNSILFQAAAEVFLSAIEVVQSYITFTTVIVVGLAYWVGSVYLEFEEDVDEVG
jgi:hypothetical protein